VKRLVLLVLLSACGARPTPDAGVRDAGTPTYFGQLACSPWAPASEGSTLATEVGPFMARGDLVIFGLGALPERVKARRLSTGTERDLGFVTPLWDSLPSENRIFELAFADATGSVTFDLQTIDVEACARSSAIAQSVRGTPAATAMISVATFCDPGFAWVTQRQDSNQLSVAGIRAVSAPHRGNLSPACADQVLSWWSTDSDSGVPGVLNWARTDVDASAQFVTEGRTSSSKGLAISTAWTLWAESNTDGGSSVHAIELSSVWDGGAARIVAAVPFTRYDAVGLRGDLATWRERTGATTRLVVMNLRDGGVIARDVPANTQHAIVESGVVTLSGGTLEWDPSFAP
jgi:hypothetical protein